MEFQDLFILWGSLAGVAALIALVINVLKMAGAVKDGTSQTWSAGLNLLGMVALFVLRIVKPDLDIAGVDAQVMAFANVAAVVLGYVIQLLSSKLTHIAITGVPVIGKSYGR